LPTRTLRKLLQRHDDPVAHTLPLSRTPERRTEMVLDAGLEKLQELLLSMTPGDQVSAARASEISGLDEAYCDAVLAALMRAGLMMRLQHDAYVRCRLEYAARESA